jgi:hypothetical protein
MKQGYGALSFLFGAGWDTSSLHSLACISTQVYGAQLSTGRRSSAEERERARETRETWEEEEEEEEEEGLGSGTQGWRARLLMDLSGGE